MMLSDNGTVAVVQDKTHPEISESGSWLDTSSPYYERPVPLRELRERETRSKRMSLFNLRPRTSLGSSPNPNARSSVADSGDHGLTRTLSEAARPGLYDATKSDLAGYKPKGMFFSRSRRSKRQHSMLRPGSALAAVREPDATEDTLDASSKSELKRQISAPFNFQHVSHASPRRVAAIRSSSHLESFWEHAIAESVHESPEELSGSRAADICIGSVPSSPLSPDDADCPSPQSPFPPREESYIRVPKEGLFSETRLHVVAEPLSERPTHISTLGGVMSSPATTESVLRITPPRSSSRNALTRFYDTPPRSSSVASAAANTADQEYMDEGGTQTSLEVVPVAKPIVAHALTTPDDSARPAVLPSRLRYGGNATHEARINKPYKPVVDPSIDTSKFHHDQWHPTSVPSCTAPELPIFMPSSKSQLLRSETLAGEHQSSAINSLPQRSSSLFIGKALLDVSELDASWEDDIDYCYEHAAEADCEFDWINTSEQAGAGNNPRPVPEAISITQAEDLTSSVDVAQSIQEVDTAGSLAPMGNPSDAFRLSLILPDDSHVPSQTSRLSFHAKDATVPLHQPSQSSSNITKFSTQPFVVLDDYGSFSSNYPCPNANIAEAKRDSYENMFAEYEGPEESLPLYDHRYANRPSLSSSSRSSGVRLSKSSSLDSIPKTFSITRAHIYGSAESLGSLPELVFSRHRGQALEPQPSQASEARESYPLSSGNFMLNAQEDNKSGSAFDSERTSISSGPVSERQSEKKPQRNRSASESAARVLFSGSSDTKPHERSSSSAAMLSTKPTYSLFPTSSTTSLR